MPVWSTLARRERIPELMDDPGLDPAEHRHALAGLARINRLSRSVAVLWPPVAALARRTADDVFIPFAIGGGIRSVADAQAVLDAGADKVAVNSAAVARPDTAGSDNSACMEETPVPNPGTGAKPAPVLSANMNIGFGVCIIRRASRFCFAK